MSDFLAAMASGASTDVLRQALIGLRPKSWDALLPALGVARTFDDGLAAKLAAALGLEWGGTTLLPVTEVVPVVADGSRHALRPDAQSQANEALDSASPPSWLPKAASILWSDAVERSSADPRAALDALRFRALLEPGLAVDDLERMAREADERCDLARLDAVLGALAEDEARGWLDPTIERTLLRWRRRAAARGAVLDAWDRTTFYQDRDTFSGEPPSPSHLADLLLDPTGPAVSVLVAGGGLGKTTFLRWLAARRLAVADPPIPVAWIDFDHVDPLLATTRADLLTCLIAGSLARWFQESGFSALAQEAGAAARQPGPGGASFLPRLGSELKREVGDGPVLVLLDTIELVLNAPAADLGGLLTSLLELQAEAPGLRVLLAGRQWRPVAAAGPVSHVQQHRLLPLPDDAARRYLAARGLDAEGAMADAIVGAAGGVPFHLGLCVDVVQGAPPGQPVDPEEFRRGPELTYLLERVIRRLRRPDAPAKPDTVLQWIVFYAAAPRRVTLGYVEHVALPVLRARGTAGFSADTPSGFTEAPVPDPAYDAPTQVWSRLAAYAATVDFLAREPDLSAGWLRSGAGADTLVLHDRVREPMRALLRDRYPLSQALHARAVRYWRSQAADAVRSGENDRWAEATSEVIFHLLQGPPSAALAAALARILRRAEVQLPPASWARAAAEFRAADYVWGEAGQLGGFVGAEAERLRFMAAVSEARAWLQSLGDGGDFERDAAYRRGLREAVQAAADAHAASPGVSHAALTILGAAVAAVHESDPVTLSDKLAEAAGLPGGVTPADRANMLLLAAETLAAAGQQERAAGLVRRVSLLDAGGNPHLQHRDDVRLCRLYMRLGKAGSALPPALRARARAERSKRPLEAAEASVVIGWAQLARSDLAMVSEVLGQLDEALREHAAVATGPVAERWRAVQQERDRLSAELLLVTLEHARLLEALEPAGALAAVGDGVRCRLRGLVAAERGDTAGGLALLAEAGSLFRSGGDAAAAVDCELSAFLITLPGRGSTDIVPSPVLDAIDAALDGFETDAGSQTHRFPSDYVLVAALTRVARAGKDGAEALRDPAIDVLLRILHRLPLGVILPILRWSLPVTVVLPPALAAGLVAFTQRLSLQTHLPGFAAHAPVAALIGRVAGRPEPAGELVRLAVQAGFHTAHPEAMFGLMRAGADLREMDRAAFAAWAEAYREALGHHTAPALTELAPGPSGGSGKALALAQSVARRVRDEISTAGPGGFWRALLNRQGRQSAKAFLAAARGLLAWLDSGKSFPRDALRALATDAAQALSITAAAVLALHEGDLSREILSALFPDATVQRLDAERLVLRAQAPPPLADPFSASEGGIPLDAGPNDASGKSGVLPAATDPNAIDFDAVISDVDTPLPPSRSPAATVPRPASVHPEAGSDGVVLRKVVIERGRMVVSRIDEEGHDERWEENPTWLGSGSPDEIAINGIVDLAQSPLDVADDLVEILDLPTQRTGMNVHLFAGQTRIVSLPWEAVALARPGTSMVRLCPAGKVVRQRPVIGTTAVLVLGQGGREATRIWGSSGFAILPSAANSSGYHASIAEAPSVMRVIVHFTGELRVEGETGLPELVASRSDPSSLSLRRLVAIVGVSRNPPVLLVLDISGPPTGAEGWLALCRRHALAAALARATGIPVASIGAGSTVSLRVLAARIQAGKALEEVPADWVSAVRPSLNRGNATIPELPAVFLPMAE